MNDEKLRCRACQRILLASHLQVIWELVTENEKVVLDKYHYCVACGTLRQEVKPGSEDE